MNFNVCSIAFVMYLLNGVPFPIFVLKKKKSSNFHKLVFKNCSELFFVKKSCFFEDLSIWPQYHKRSQGGGRGQGARIPPIEMLTMIKMSRKRLMFLQL